MMMDCLFFRRPIYGIKSAGRFVLLLAFFFATAKMLLIQVCRKKSKKTIKMCKKI
jgi:hypothetical protein